MRNLVVAGSYNVRDLGGLATADGQLTRRKIFIRAGNLDQVSAEGYQFITDYGVKTIIDLRDEWEVEAYPNVFAHAVDMQYANLPLIGNGLAQDEKWKAASEAYSHLHELYAYYLEECQAQIGTIMQAVTASTTGTIIHCYAGKDRTGLIAALVLGAVGVADDVIAADYAETSAQIVPLVTAWRAYAVANGRDMVAFERDAAAEPQTMIDTLGHLRARYGGVIPYLLACGVTEAQVREIQERLVEGEEKSD